MGGCVANNLYPDSENKSESNIFLRFPCVLDPVLIDHLKQKFHNDNFKLEGVKKFSGSVIEILAASDSPRFIKSHLPLSLLPPRVLDDARVVYVARDPRDVAVSYYHFSRLLGFFGYTGDFKTFWNFFINDMRKYSKKQCFCLSTLYLDETPA